MSEAVVDQRTNGRCINFGAGPAQLPESVLDEAREALSDWKGTGVSIAEYDSLPPHLLLHVLSLSSPHPLKCLKVYWIRPRKFE